MSVLKGLDLDSHRDFLKTIMANIILTINPNLNCKWDYFMDTAIYKNTSKETIMSIAL